MKLADIKIGHSYKHETYNTVTIVGPHPHDGRAFIVAYNDDELDEEVFKLAIPEEIEYEVFNVPVFVQELVHVGTTRPSFVGTYGIEWNKDVVGKVGNYTKIYAYLPPKK